MFETLQERLAGIFDKLTGRGALSEADVDAAMREVAALCSRPTWRSRWCAPSSTR